MKRQLILTLLGLVVATPLALAGQITVGIYVDPAGTSCNIIDDQPGLLSVYVVTSAPDGATAVQFAAPKPNCMVGATWLSDTCWPCLIGNSQVGTAIGFGACLTGKIHVLTINYFAVGTTEQCCLYPVIPDPHVASGQIEATDCDYHLMYAWGEASTVNGDSSCPCGYPVATDATTWGEVKSLYAD